MGLCLEIGILAQLRGEDLDAFGFYLSQFEAVNEVLQLNGRPLHQEPSDARCETWSCEMYAYSGVHYLRRIAAHVWTNGRLPSPGDDDAAEDPACHRYYDSVEDPSTPPRPFDHLMLHSDAEGFYLPQLFSPVIYTTEEQDVMGNIIGSSVALARELEQLAELLHLPLDIEPDGPEIWEALELQGSRRKGWQRYGIESFTCLRLYQGCVRSMRTGAALVMVAADDDAPDDAEDE
jgi:hypothetical protein